MIDIEVPRTKVDEQEDIDKGIPRIVSIVQLL